MKDKPESTNRAVAAFLTAITLLGMAGLGIMLAGALILHRAAGLGQDAVGVFMLFTFLITVLTEVMLIRQLSRVTGSKATTRALPPEQVPPHELRPPSVEPFPSVTENTTRTLEYLRRDQK